MKGIDFCTAMSYVSKEYIEEADKLRGMTVQKKNKAIKFACLAASLTIILFAGAVGAHRIYKGSKLKALPMLSVENDISNGNGFEGYLALNISELVNENPWDEAKSLKALPVYKNPVTYNEMQRPANADFDKMRERLKEIAERFGLSEQDYTISDDSPDEERKEVITKKLIDAGGSVPQGYFDPTSLIAETGSMTIKVFADLSVSIDFEPALELPKDIHCSFNSSYEDCLRAAEYFKAEFENIIGFNDPIININGGDRDIYGEQKLTVSFYDNSDSYLERILNYNFSTVTFSCYEDEKLHGIRIMSPDLTQKVGDYPIISVSEARAMLENGEYINDNNNDIKKIDAVNVEKIELVYRQDRYFMPYYKFYVKSYDYHLEYQGQQLNTYIAYYVPAVKSEYLEPSQLWIGSFNSRDVG